jgi:hypothetical protein
VKESGNLGDVERHIGTESHRHPAYSVHRLTTKNNGLAHSREAILRSTSRTRLPDSIAKRECSARNAESSRSRRQRKRSASKRYKLPDRYRENDNSLELHLPTGGFKNRGTEAALPEPTSAFVATRFKSSPTLNLRTPPRASNKRSYPR